MTTPADELWDLEAAKLAMVYPKLHRAIVNSLCGEFAWLNQTTRVRLLTAALVALGHHEIHRNMNGMPFVGDGSHERELADMVRELRAAFLRAFPATPHNWSSLTMAEIKDMQDILCDKSFPGVDRELVKEVG
jgi:hypothetical protein